MAHLDAGNERPRQTALTRSSRINRIIVPALIVAAFGSGLGLLALVTKGA